MSQFVIVITPDEGGGYVVAVPDLPGCVTHGDTLDLALAHASEAIALYLDGEDAASLAAAGVRPEVVADILRVPIGT